MNFYIYVTSESLQGLEKKVNEKYKEGYIKSSSLCFTTLGVGNQVRTFCVQPMELKEEKQ